KHAVFDGSFDEPDACLGEIKCTRLVTQLPVAHAHADKHFAFTPWRVQFRCWPRASEQRGGLVVPLRGLGMIQLMHGVNCAHLEIKLSDQLFRGMNTLPAR